MHQGTNDLSANGARIIYYRLDTCFMHRGSATPVGD
jgi:hypothetical protein